MRAVAIPVSGLPVQLVCAEDGTISFVKLWPFKAIIDHPQDGVCAIITEEDIFIGADTVVEYDTRYNYKEMPELAAWVTAQNVQMPVFK